jgi:hypothetical protein
VSDLLHASSRMLDHMAGLLADGDETTLRALLERARTKRRGLFQNTPSADAAAHAQQSGSTPPK